MRLVCPNCEAKYEVPDDAIPETGRDVQCTNCSHSWYQMRGRSGAAPWVATSLVTEAAAADPSAAPDAVAQTAPADFATETDAAGLVEAVSDASEEVASAAVASLEDLSAAEAAGGLALAAEAGDPALTDVEAAALQDAEPEAEITTVAGSEPASGVALADEIEPVVDGTGGVDMAFDAGQTPEPSPVTDVSALPEATGIVEETVADLIAGEAAMDAVPDVALDAAEAPSDATTDDAPAPAPAYAVDDSVLAILREEAEREANARRADALESQTDLGIDQAMPRKAGALAAMAETKTSARRDLLPDVEEINSTLRPSDMHDAADAPDFVAPPPEAPRAFRSGFLSLMTIAILAAALYLVAPRLAVMVPALAGPLESYVSMVDSMRLGLDGMMRSATVAISDG